MDENDRKLLDKYGPSLQQDLDLTQIIAILMQSGLLSDAHLEELKVVNKNILNIFS